MRQGPDAAWARSEQRRQQQLARPGRLIGGAVVAVDLFCLLLPGQCASHHRPHRTRDISGGTLANTVFAAMLSLIGIGAVVFAAFLGRSSSEG